MFVAFGVFRFLGLEVVVWWWGGIIVSLVFGVGTGIWEGGDGVDVSGIVGWHMVGGGGR